MSWLRWAGSELAAIREQDRWRELVAFDAAGVHGELHGRDVVCFASNDYLGLSQHPEVKASAALAVQQFGTSATASRLVVGHRSIHAELEQTIARWKNAEAALVLSSGFATNLAVLTTLATADVTIFSDAWNHASIIDGCRLAKAGVEIYRHADLDHLESLLRRCSSRRLVVSDTVFSMDGDVAPVQALGELCARYDALLVLDEAHAVFGEGSMHLPCEVVRVGTLSKTLGALGGWVAGPQPLVQLLINRARSFVYSTGLSPADTAAALAASNIVRSDEGRGLQRHLREVIDAFQPAHPTPIVPIVVGSDAAAVDIARQLLVEGFYVPAIRPPTVPQGTARLRVTLSALHTLDDVRRLRSILTLLMEQVR